MPDVLPTPPQSARSEPASDARKKLRNRTWDRFLDLSKSLVWVIPLTILVWVYAERETSHNVEGVTIPIGVRINSPDKTVVMEDPADGKIVATVYGSNTAVQNLLTHISNYPNQAVVTRTLDGTTPRGETLIEASAIANDTAFKSVGILVSKVTPGTIRVKVDDVVTEELPVIADHRDWIEGEMRFSPSVVRVTAPRGIFDQAKAIEQLRFPGKVITKPWLTADPDKLNSYANQPGPHDNIPGVSVSLESQTNPNLRISNPTVSASFVVKQTLGHYVAVNVPIYPGGPVDFMRTHDISLVNGSTIPSVALIGSQESIAKLKELYQSNNDVAPVIANLYVFEGRSERVAPTFTLPEGIRLEGKAEDYAQDIHVTAR